MFSLSPLPSLWVVLEGEKVWWWWLLLLLPAVAGGGVWRLRRRRRVRRRRHGRDRFRVGLEDARIHRRGMVMMMIGLRNLHHVGATVVGTVRGVLLLLSQPRFLSHATIALHELLAGSNIRHLVILLLHPVVSIVVVRIHGILVIVAVESGGVNVRAAADHAPDGTPRGHELLLQTQRHQPLTQFLQVPLPELHGVGRDAPAHQELGFVDLRHDLLTGEAFGGGFPLFLVA
mmetsp:Transcript_12297/g.26542  ORF Transcript_12297/g.26542 Transcript_12297/m.26542 type:complete len:231 (+) Transcript_12297:666-1358(+)